MQISLALRPRMPVKGTKPYPMLAKYFSAIMLLSLGGNALAQSQYESSTDFAKYAMKLRENALLKVEPKVVMSPTKTTFTGEGQRYETGPSLMGRSNALFTGPGRYGWKSNIVTTIFWIGERPSGNNPVPNDRSSWDKYWSSSYGGDEKHDPAGGRPLFFARFFLRHNPFYLELPYKNCDSGGAH